MRALELLRDLVEEKTGIHHPDAQLDLLLEKVRPRLAELGLTSLMDYYYTLKYDDPEGREWEAVFQAVTVNETYFFREMDQLQGAVDEVIPGWIERLGGAPVRVWHAGCATGEEPYSLVLALEAAGLGSAPVEVVASDLDRAVLRAAREGLYRARSVRCLSPALLERWFTREGPELWRLSSRIRERVRFRHLNLADPGAIAALGRFHVIFCRNVFIYFRDAQVRAVARAFHDALEPGGTLFLGAAESLLRLATDFDLVRVGCAPAYRR